MEILPTPWIYRFKKEKMMKWESQSEQTLKNLFIDNTYDKWSKGIENGEIEEFNSHLKELLSRLAGVAVSEFEIDYSEKIKIMKLMELAAMAGKKL